MCLLPQALSFPLWDQLPSYPSMQSLACPVGAQKQGHCHNGLHQNHPLDVRFLSPEGPAEDVLGSAVEMHCHSLIFT